MIIYYNYTVVCKCLIQSENDEFYIIVIKSKPYNCIVFSEHAVLAEASLKSLLYA